MAPGVNGKLPMPPTDRKEATRAELFVRGDLPAPVQRRQENVVSRLDALVASGALDEYSVSSWAKRVPFDADADAGRTERDRFSQFDEWARATGVRLTPFFDARECYSWTTGERRTELVLPAVCLALYDGDDLVCVVPCADESDSVSVTDCLDRLDDESESSDSSTLLAAD